MYYKYNKGYHSLAIGISSTALSTLFPINMYVVLVLREHLYYCRSFVRNISEHFELQYTVEYHTILACFLIER